MLHCILGRPIAIRQQRNTTEVAFLVPDTQNIDNHNNKDNRDNRDNRDNCDHRKERIKEIRSYFQLEYDLAQLYAEWSNGCPRMASIVQLLKGVRVVRQDPWECLISFICSSNNNIKRITIMLDRLKRKYGTYLCSLKLSQTSSGQTAAPCWEVVVVDPTLDGDENLEALEVKQELERELKQEFKQEFKQEIVEQQQQKQKELSPVDRTEMSPMIGDMNSSLFLSPTASTISKQGVSPSKSAKAIRGVLPQKTLHHFYRFPTIDALAGATEEDLRLLGFGYRAKFIINSAKLVQGKPNGGGHLWLQELRAQENRLAVQEALMELPGVGRKVADCVALFSLDQAAAIPVDTVRATVRTLCTV